MAGSPTRNDFSEIQSRLLAATKSRRQMGGVIVDLLQSHKSLAKLKPELDAFFKVNPVSIALSDKAEGLRYLQIFYALVCFGYQNTAIDNLVSIESQNKKLGDAVRMSLLDLVAGVLVQPGGFESFGANGAKKPKEKTLNHNQLDSGIRFLTFHFDRVLSVASGSDKPSTKGYVAIVRAFLEGNSPAPVTRLEPASVLSVPVSSNPEAGAGCGGGAAAVAFASAACASASGSAEINVREVASQLMDNYKTLILSLYALKMTETGNAESALFEPPEVREKYGNLLRSLQLISEGGSNDLSAIESHITFHADFVAPLIKLYKPDNDVVKSVAIGFQTLRNTHKNQQALEPSLP